MPHEQADYILRCLSDNTLKKDSYCNPWEALVSDFHAGRGLRFHFRRILCLNCQPLWKLNMRSRARTSVSGQNYVEDCEVCCRPILIAYESDGEEVTSFDAQATN